MNKYFVNIDKLEEEGTNMVSYADETIAVNVQELIDLASKLEWDGPTYEMFSQLYIEKMNKIKRLAGMVKAYGEFMKLASKSYSGANDDVRTKFQEIIDDIKNEYN